MTINREVARIASRTNKIDRNHVYPLVMNGDMRVAQRGTSTSSVSTDVYTCVDRWRTNINSYGAYTISQSTTVPSGQGFKHSFKIDCTTADASPASGDLFTFEQRMEGQDCQLFNKGTSDCTTWTLAFWIKSNLTGNFTVNLVDEDNSRRVGSLVTIAQADTWEKKVLNFPADTTGALGVDNGDSFRIQFFLGVGSNFTSGTLPSAWESATTANFAAGQTAFIGSSTDNEVFFTGVQLELGTFSADNCPEFQFLDQATQLKQCQRYYQMIINGDDQFIGNGHFHADDYVFVPAHFKNTMRAAPTAEVTTASQYWATEGGNNIAAFDNIDGVAHATNKGALFYTDGDNVNAVDPYTGNSTCKVRSNHANARLALTADL